MVTVTVFTFQPFQATDKHGVLIDWQYFDLQRAIISGVIAMVFFALPFILSGVFRIKTNKKH